MPLVSGVCGGWWSCRVIAKLCSAPLVELLTQPGVDRRELGRVIARKDETAPDAVGSADCDAVVAAPAAKRTCSALRGGAALGTGVEKSVRIGGARYGFIGLEQSAANGFRCVHGQRVPAAATSARPGPRDVRVSSTAGYGGDLRYRRWRLRQ